MKKSILTIMVLLIVGLCFAQTQQSIKYQTVIRDGNGDVIPNQNMTLKISILQGNPTGTVVYAERHNIVTNDFGLVNTAVGTGEVLSGDFQTIEWGADTYYLQTEIDIAGGNNYQLLGTTQVMAVPIAIYAEEAGNVVYTDTSAINELQILTLIGDTIIISNGNYIVITELINQIWECGDIMIDDRDGESYKTVQIGAQCWMAENLNIGVTISVSNDQLDNSIIEKYCYYGTSYCHIYGGLYQWDEMMQYTTIPGAQGICPTGWHLPTDDEWKIMEMQLGMTQAEADASGLRGIDVGGRIKEGSALHWETSNESTNSSGFSAVGGGMRKNSNESFEDILNYGFYWTSWTHYSGGMARVLKYNETGVFREGHIKMDGLSVRCVLD